LILESFISYNYYSTNLWYKNWRDQKTPSSHHWGTNKHLNTATSKNVAAFKSTETDSSVKKLELLKLLEPPSFFFGFLQFKNNNQI